MVGKSSLVRAHSRFRIVMALAIAAMLVPPLEGARRRIVRGGSAQPPPEFAALYSELSAELTRFERSVDTRWDGSRYPTAFVGTLGPANGNNGASLLSPAALQRTRSLLDAFQWMGVDMVKVDITYPMLTEPFHQFLRARDPSYAGRATDYINFYKTVATEARTRGLGLLVEHSSLIPTFTGFEVGAYYNEVKSGGGAAARQRYRDERIAEAETIARELDPAYLSLLLEPETQNQNFGLVGGTRLYTPELWQAFLEVAAQRVRATGRSARLGAGAGTWEPRDYIELFAAMPSLDYIDFHIYPIRGTVRSYLETAIDWSRYVRAVAPAKRVTIGEAWLYKVGATEFSGDLAADDLYARDVWSFWQPLDQQFLEILYKLANLERIDVVAPFWSGYFFAYLDYNDSSLRSLPPGLLLGRAGVAAIGPIERKELTGTGQRFREILSR